MPSIAMTMNYRPLHLDSYIDSLDRAKMFFTGRRSGRVREVSHGQWMSNFTKAIWRLAS